jgi:hypothetical protein
MTCNPKPKPTLKKGRKERKRRRKARKRSYLEAPLQETM